jgi:hypothetical protein
MAIAFLEVKVAVNGGLHATVSAFKLKEGRI